MRWRIPLVVVLALFAAVSCDQQPAGPPAEQVAEAPTLNFMNNPDAGPKIWRFQESWGFWFDNVDGHLIVVGLDPADLCGDWSSVDFTSVFTPNDDPDDEWFWGRWIDNWQIRDAPASIYDYAGPFDCEIVQALEPLATGMGRANGNDNDLFHWNPDAETGNNNANTWGWNLHASMGEYVYNAHSHCRWNDRGVQCKFKDGLN